jgi:hypothetical protein
VSIFGSARTLLRPLRRWFDRVIASDRFLRYQAAALDRCARDRDVTTPFDGHAHVLFRRDCYLPFPDEQDLGFSKRSELVGINVDEEACFAFHDANVKAFDAEFRKFPYKQTTSPDDYFLLNGTFMAIDGNMYYGLIRKLAPRTVIEIGAGNSTKLACQAIRRNRDENRPPTKLICIEPFEIQQLASLKEISNIIPSYVQAVDLALFETLGPNDILFIDSTHTVRPGGDVWWEICEILPRLKSGVLVHIHDVSLPNPYPKQYLKNHWYWMEQYMLQAFLTFNDRFSIVWPGNLLMLKHQDRMRRLFSPEYAAMISDFPCAEPASFWLRVN